MGIGCGEDGGDVPTEGIAGEVRGRLDYCVNEGGHLVGPEVHGVTRHAIVEGVAVRLRGGDIGRPRMSLADVIQSVDGGERAVLSGTECVDQPCCLLVPVKDWKSEEVK